MNALLEEHLQSGLTFVCRCWELRRKDGVRMGFTDHDTDLEFGGLVFQAHSGLSASALVQGTGLAVDNTEAIGALDSELLREEDIARGVYDGAEVVVWLVNWDNPDAREVLFRGHAGEITRQEGQFRVELRSLVDRLNQPKGRVFQKPCSAVLGDARCRLDTAQYAYQTLAEIVAVDSESQVRVRVDGGYAERWFERGRLVLSEGGFATIKRDDIDGLDRVLTFWSKLPEDVAVGKTFALIAGCDRDALTCREKFDNIRNFQGFPDIPGDDWLMSLPTDGQIHDGASRR